MKVTASQIDSLDRQKILEAISMIANNPSIIDTSSSSQHDVIYHGKRYPPNQVIAFALSLTSNAGTTISDLPKTLESNCIKILIRCGFTLSPKKKNIHLSFSDAFIQILDYQKMHSSKNTPEMQKRGELIRHDLPGILWDNIESFEPIFSNAGFSCSIEGKDGIGNKTASAWVRIFDPIMSPSATEGWYVVIHFSCDGQRVYFTLGRGATTLKDGGLRDVPDQELAGQIGWAREIIASKFEEIEDFNDEIKLEGNALSAQFEKATAFAKVFTVERFDKVNFTNNLKRLCEFLIPLYELERLGKDPFSQAPELNNLIEAIEQITSPRKKSGRGQGRGLTHPERKAIELRAMSVCMEELLKRGFTKIKDMSADHSFDYSGHYDGIDWLIEVKGTTSVKGDSFLLSGPEFNLHKRELGRTILVIVYDIDLDKRADPPVATNGKVEIYMPWNLELWKFEPKGYTVTKI